MQDLDPFRSGSLTDVAGVLVGHHHRRRAGWQTGTTVVFVEHNLGIVRVLADNVIVLNAGRVIRAGSMPDIEAMLEKLLAE